MSTTEPMTHVVERYFGEVVADQRLDLLKALATEDVVLHRPGLMLRGRPAVLRQIKNERAVFASFRSQLSNVMVADDRLALSVRHVTTLRPGTFQGRAGSAEVGDGVTMTWDAMVMFRFVGAQIAETWLVQDEIGMAMQAGTLRLEARR